MKTYLFEVFLLDTSFICSKIVLRMFMIKKTAMKRVYRLKKKNNTFYLNTGIFLAIFLLWGTIFGQANRVRIYDDNNDLVREEVSETRRNGNVQTFQRLTHHYREGTLTHSDDYLRTIERVTGYLLREEIFARIDDKGNRNVNRIRRYKETNESIPGGEETQKLNEDLDSDGNYRSYQLQIERNTRHVNEDGRQVRVYERLRYDQHDNKTHHYKRSTMNYENQQGIDINQVVENNFSPSGNLQDIKVTRRYEVDGVQHVKIEHSHFDSNGSISRRNVVESERWRENPETWKEVKTTRNYEGQRVFLNETREEKTTSSTADIYKETQKIVRMDKNRTVVEETKNEKVVEKRPLPGYQDGSRTVTIQYTYDNLGRQISQEKVIEERLEQSYSNRRENIYRRKVLDQNENLIEDREDRSINYHSGELQSVEERRRVRGERLMHHWRRENSSSGGRRTEVLKNFDIHGNEVSRTRTVRDTV